MSVHTMKNCRTTSLVFFSIEELIEITVAKVDQPHNQRQFLCTNPYKFAITNPFGHWQNHSSLKWDNHFPMTRIFLWFNRFYTPLSFFNFTVWNHKTKPQKVSPETLPQPSGNPMTPAHKTRNHQRFGDRALRALGTEHWEPWGLSTQALGKKHPSQAGGDFLTPWSFM